MADNQGFDSYEEGTKDTKVNGSTNTPEEVIKTEALGPTVPPLAPDQEPGHPDELQNGSVATVEFKSELMYTVDESPPWYTCTLLGMQHYLIMVGATISIPFILTPLMCIDNNDPTRGAIVSTILFVSGMVTLLQSTFGVRLPIVQGGTFSFLVPTIAILTTSFTKCEDLPLQNMTSYEREEVWQVRMREIQGAIAVSAFFQILVGFTGLIGLLLTWITPLTIVPTVTLVGLSLFDVAADKASLHWGISFLTIGLLVIFSQYIRNLWMPLPTWNKSTGFNIQKIFIFKLFPVLIAILMSWGFCAILTATDVIPEGNPARTDLTTELLQNSPWFRLPYPGQWGLPTVSVASVFGMLAGVLASMIESVGDYYACAKLSGAEPPPVHAVNRGVGIEGIGCLLAGIWGTGNGTTSYSENIGAIGVTKVGSRRVVQFGAVIMMIFGIFGKIGALFVTIPGPVVGGVFCVMFAMITAVGLSSLQYVDLNSSRNLFVLGFSLFIGVALPKWLEAHPGVIVTGSDIGDQILTVMLQTSMFVGGVLGFFLDNTVPGTDEERGLLKWNAHRTNNNKRESNEDAVVPKTSCYDLPFGMDVIRRTRWMKYVPVSPTFTGFKRRKSSVKVFP